MEMIRAVVGLVVNEGKILVVQNSGDRGHFKSLFMLPMAVLGCSPGNDASELENLANEFSGQLGIGFDFSRGSWGEVFTYQENSKRVYQILPLRGGLTKYDNFILGPHYSEATWVTPDDARSIALGPIFEKCLDQFGL
jgi:hypothetical protein